LVYPVIIGTQRVLEKDIMLQGYTIPKGVRTLHNGNNRKSDNDIYSRCKMKDRDSNIFFNFQLSQNKLNN